MCSEAERRTNKGLSFGRRRKGGHKKKHLRFSPRKSLRKKSVEMLSQKGGRIWSLFSLTVLFPPRPRSTISTRRLRVGSGRKGDFFLFRIQRRGRERIPFNPFLRSILHRFQSTCLRFLLHPLWGGWVRSRCQNPPPSPFSSIDFPSSHPLLPNISADISKIPPIPIRLKQMSHSYADKTSF